MNSIERLAVEQAMYNAIGRDLKTGVTHNLRGEVNQYYLDQYEHTGATGFEVRLNGMKVGTYGFNKVKGRDGYVETEFVVHDSAAALMAAEGDDPDFRDFAYQWFVDRIAECAEGYFRATGCVPDGCSTMEHVVPATPDGIRPNGTLRVDVGRVAAALGPALPSTVAGVLGIGEVDDG